MQILKPPVRRSRASGAFRLFGSRQLLANAAGIWFTLAVIGIAAGIYWRQTGTTPELRFIIDGLGAVYWLLPVLLIRTWESVGSRITRHQLVGPGVRRSHWILAVTAAEAAYFLAVAPLGLFISYDSRIAAARIFTTDSFTFTVDYTLLICGLLCVVGSAIFILSFLIINAFSRLAGKNLGLSLWLLTGALGNLAVICRIPENLPLSLSRILTLAQTRLSFTQLYPTHSINLSDLIWELLVIPLAIVGILTLLLYYIQQYPTRKVKGVRYYYYALFAGITIPAIGSAVSGAAWTKDHSIGSAGSWQLVFGSGLTLVLLWTLVSFISSREDIARSNPLYSWLIVSISVPVWIGFSTPAIIAGSTSFTRLIPVALCCTAVIGLWTTILQVIAARGVLSRGAVWLVVSVMIVSLLIPLSRGASTSLVLVLEEVYYYTIQHGESASIIAALVLLNALAAFLMNRISKNMFSGYLQNIG